MCFDLDSRPPIAPIAGGALDAGRVLLTATDGNRFLGFRARPADPGGAAIAILPDVRGLHRYYEELALRFAEAGVEALAIDWFGRTTGADTPRDDSFEFWPHVERTTWAGISADITAAAATLRTEGPGRVYCLGFCMGGRMAFLSATLGLGLAGVVGFYGTLVGPWRNDAPEPVVEVARMTGPVLGLFGGADAGIPPAHVAAFDAALDDAGIAHRLVTYDGAPHSFFDRKATEFADASAAAWTEVLTFIQGPPAA